MAGADAIVVTVGSAKGVHHQRAAVTRCVIAAMHETGTRRLLVQSSLGAGTSGSQLPGTLRVAMKALLAKPLADHNEQEASEMASGPDWTIVRPTGLTDTPATGSWRALEVTDSGRLGGSIGRADLAACMLEKLSGDSAIAAAFGVSS